MALTEYQRALKMGEKAAKAAAAKGEYPYLPALDEFLKTADILDEIPIGLVEIPLEQIVGTRTAGRQNAFAPNFMPLMPEKSEFAMKWTSLFEYQKEEGVKDPIIAYEFMNRYYVLEGNKRVSVFKYLDAFSIEGNVIRIIPKRSSDPLVRSFYEYMSFSRHSRLNDIVFYRPGGYASLLKVLGMDPEHDWTEQERENVHAAFSRFLRLYQEKGGKKLGITSGDAFLSYLMLFPIGEMEGKTDAQLRDEISRIWTEIGAIGASATQALIMDPSSEETENPFSRFLHKMGAASGTVLQVGFIHEFPPEQSGWTYSHELGRMHLEQKFAGKIRTNTYTLDEYSQNRDLVLDSAVEDGNYILFTTNETLLNASLKAAVKYPRVKILNCCVNRPHKLIRTYYGRLYEVKFLEGMIAGAMSENDRIAYTASYPIFGTVANINAFALGAQMTNPRAKVYLHWSSRRDADLEGMLARDDIYITSDTEAMRPGSRDRRYGLYLEKNGSRVNLAMPVWNWGKFYEKILRDILSGNWNSTTMRERPALNYWWGISGDIIDIIIGRSLPAGLKTLVMTMKDQIYTGAFQPFSGVIYAQDGTRMGAERGYLSPEEIITMDWLCENVIGEIPEADQLNERAQMILRNVDLPAWQVPSAKSAILSEPGKGGNA